MAGQIPPAAGGGTITIAGHKISKSLAIAGALASLLGLFLVLRARSQGSSTTVGSAPSAAAAPGLSPSLAGYGLSAGTDYTAALDNIESQLAQIQQGGAAAPAPAPTLNPFHYGPAQPADTGWQWLPSIAAKYNLPTGVQPIGSAPVNMAAFQAQVGGQSVPVADSWGYV